MVHRNGDRATIPDLVHEGQPPKGWPLDRDPFFLETSVPGIFAAGDVRHGSIKRVASSVGEGAMAVQLIHRYLAQYPQLQYPHVVSFVVPPVSVVLGFNEASRSSSEARKHILQAAEELSRQRE